MTKPSIQILMIEDNRVDVLLLKDALSRDLFTSFEVTVAESLSSGLESICRGKFDLILLDLGLPDSQGIETFKKIHAEHPELPVVVLSGLMDERLALEVVGSGAQDFLVKGPASWEIASRAIRHAIERQQSQTALRETNEALQALIQSSPIGIVVFDPEGKIKLWSPANERIFGWSEAETVGRLLPYIPAEKEEEHRALRQRVLNGEAFTGIEVRRRRKDGTPVDISVSTAPLRDGQGNIIGIMGLNADISEHKQAQQALAEAHSRLSATVAAIPDMMFELDLEGRILDYHAPVREELYDQTGAFLGKPLEQVLPPEAANTIHQALAQAAFEGRHRGATYALDLPTGRHWYELSIATKPGISVPESRFLALARDITERKHAEAALRESEERFRTLIEQSSEGIVLIGEQGNILEWNHAMEHITGIPRAQAASLKVWDVQFLMVPLEHRSLYSAETIGALFSKALETGTLPHSRERIEVEIQTAGGERKIVTQTIFAIKTAIGYRLGSIVLDITQRKQAERALRESEERFRSLYNNATIGLYRTTPDGQILMCNPAAVRLLGFESYEELAQRNLEEDGFEPNYSRQEFHERMERDGMVIGLECEWTRKDGASIFVRESATVVRDSEEKILYYDGTFEDITERKRAEEALRASEERFRRYFELGLIGMAITSPVKGILEVNDQICANLGYAREELLQKTWAELTHPDDLATDLAQFNRVMAGEIDGYSLEKRWIRKDGQVIHSSISVRCIRRADGSVDCFLGLVQDITERKRAEETILLNEKKFKTLFEIAPVGISVLDREQNVVDANYALQRITGLQKKELMNGGYRNRTYLRPDGSSMIPEELASSRALREDMPIFDVETGIVTEDRGVVWTQISAAPLHMPDAGLVVITQDISERKLTEQSLHQRVAELETLYESGLSLSQLLEPKQIGQKIIGVLTEKLDWYHTTIRLYHPETNTLELLAYNLARKSTKKERKDLNERFKTLIAKPGDGLSGWVVQHGETVRCNDVLRDTRYVETVPGIRSGLYVPIKTGERAIGVISVESEKQDYFTPEDEHLAVTLAAQAAVAFENIRLFKDLQKSNDDLFLAYDETIAGWSHALDLRDRETEGHTQRVTTLTEELARKMGVADSELIHIRRGSLLHDIGKMGVPDRILLKPDKLTEEEWVIMRQHPVHAYNLLSRIEFLRPALNIPHYHHERWNGSGYPDGLMGEQIPLEARIFAVVDVFDALISDRPYRPGWPRDKAIQYICKQSGLHFDPRVVEAFMKMIGRQASAAQSHSFD